MLAASFGGVRGQNALGIAIRVRPADAQIDASARRRPLPCFGGLAEDVLDALDRGRDGVEVLAAAHLGDGLGAGESIDHIVSAGGEHGVGDIVGEAAGIAQIELKTLAEEGGDVLLEYWATAVKRDSASLPWYWRKASAMS